MDSFFSDDVRIKGIFLYDESSSSFFLRESPSIFARKSPLIIAAGLDMSTFSRASSPVELVTTLKPALLRWVSRTYLVLSSESTTRT